MLAEKFPVDIDTELVDLVLTILHRNKLSNYKTTYEALPLNKKLKEFEFEGVIKMLIEDGYIFLFDGTFYALTVRGHLFWNAGSYRQQQKNIKARYRKDITYTICVGAGTALAGLYGLFEIFRLFYHHILCH